MYNHPIARISIVPKEKTMQRFQKVTPISYEQQYAPIHPSSVLAPWNNPVALFRDQAPVIKNQNMQQCFSDSLPEESFQIGIKNNNEESVALDKHSHSKATGVDSTNKCGKGLCIILVVMSLFIVIALGISIYGFILMMTINSTITSTTTTTTTTSNPLRWNTTGITVAGTTGLAGTAVNQLSSPYHFALNSSESLYISDTGNHRIQKYLKGASSGTLIAGVSGIASIAANYLNNPCGITIDSSNNIYVADRSNNRIAFWPVRATTGTIINPGLTLPYGLARNPNTNTLYVADTNNHRILGYTTSVASVVAGGTGGTGPTQLLSPRGVYFESSSASLIIANTGAHNIVRWQLGDTSWTLIAGTTGVSGSLSTQLSSPGGVTLDKNGNIYVADTNNHRIQLFIPNQLNGITIAGVSNIIGNNATLLNYPSTIVLDSNHNLYVADTNNHRIQKFQRY